MTTIQQYFDYSILSLGAYAKDLVGNITTAYFADNYQSASERMVA